jgi:hypothetical protein
MGTATIALTNQIRFASRRGRQAPSQEVIRESGRVGCIEIGCRKVLAFVPLTGDVDDQNEDEEQQRRQRSKGNPFARPQSSPSKYHDDSEGIRVKRNMLGWCVTDRVNADRTKRGPEWVTAII